MKKLIDYNEESFGKILDILPLGILRKPFSDNQKKYASYIKGFRPQALSLEKLRKHYFELIYIKKDQLCYNLVDDLLSQLINKIKANADKNSNYENNYIKAVAESIVNSEIKHAPDIYLYALEYTEEEKEKILSQIDVLLVSEKIEKDYKQQLLDREKEHEQVIAELNRTYSLENIKMKETVVSEANEIAILKKNIVEFTKQVDLLQKTQLGNAQRIKEKNKQIEELKKQVENFEKKHIEEQDAFSQVTKELEKLSKENALLKENTDLIKLTIKEEIKGATVKRIQEELDVKAINEEELEESFRDNLADTGCDSKTTALLASLLISIIYSKRIVLSNKIIAEYLSKIIAATIDGGRYIKIIFDNADFGSQSLINFLNNVEEKIIYLDSFVGRFDESYLSSILSECNGLGKIFICSVAYDSQLKFLPEEILDTYEYINFKLNLSKIKFDELFFSTITVSKTNKHENAAQKKLDDLYMDRSVSKNCKLYKLTNNTIIAYILYQFIPYLKYARGIDMEEAMHSIKDDSVKQIIRRYVV